LEDGVVAALKGAPLAWARVDRGLNVLEASDWAKELFHAGEQPASLIALVRTPEAEDCAREILTGHLGSWEIDALHFGRRVRMSGVALDDGGAVLFFEDLTEVRRLESVRTEFVANLAHELRTPVTSLRLAIETLQSGLSDAERETFLARVLEGADYIGGVLDNLSQLARLESGPVPLERELFFLVELVAETWARVVPSGSSVHVAVEVEPELQLDADRHKVAQVLQNLLENAHRYSPQEGVIVIAATARQGEVEVSVADQGPGMPPADLSRIFERFYKADRSRSRAGGSGLGLAIAKHLVEAHGGRIWAEAAPEGGTRVAFTLPEAG
jgi:two-component system phosphate regulon sensor histidine kinase PhoR